MRYNRRQFIADTIQGLPGIALAAMFAKDALAESPDINPEKPYAPRRPHFAPKAKRVVEIFCSGALSHVDTFDYKPDLIR